MQAINLKLTKTLQKFNQAIDRLTVLTITTYFGKDKLITDGIEIKLKYFSEVFFKSKCLIAGCLVSFYKSDVNLN